MTSVTSSLVLGTILLAADQLLTMDTESTATGATVLLLRSELAFDSLACAFVQGQFILLSCGSSSHR